METKVKLQDKTGVSRQYQIALANPTIATVAALQETWIRFVGDSVKQLENLHVAVRRAVADYMRTEGCDCCRDIDGHRSVEKRLALLLNVPKYDDGSGYNFSLFRSKKRP